MAFHIKSVFVTKEFEEEGAPQSDSLSSIHSAMVGFIQSKDLMCATQLFGSLGISHSANTRCLVIHNSRSSILFAELHADASPAIAVYGVRDCDLRLLVKFEL